MIQLIFTCVSCLLLTKMHEADVIRIRRFLQNRGLIDIPNSGQRDYTDSVAQAQDFGDGLKIIDND